jgi:hypothetical protein
MEVYTYTWKYRRPCAGRRVATGRCGVAYAPAGQPDAPHGGENTRRRVRCKPASRNTRHLTNRLVSGSEPSGWRGLAGRAGPHLADARIGPNGTGEWWGVMNTQHTRHGWARLTGWIRDFFAIPDGGQPHPGQGPPRPSPRRAGFQRGTLLKGQDQLREAAEVLERTRASGRQRHDARVRIIRACNEGRLSDKACDARLESASRAVTTEELARLTSDLGVPDRAGPVRTTALLYTLLVLVALLPAFLSHRWWLILAVPLIIIAALGIWALPHLLMSAGSTQVARQNVARQTR